MGEAPKEPKARRWTDAVLIMAFGLLLALPAADNVLHLDHSPAFNENRALAAFPTLKGSLAGLQDYVRGLDAYFNDHFGWRKQLIRWHTSVEFALFGQENSKDVLWGRDGWLYFTHTGDEPDARGSVGFSLHELEQLREALEERRDWLARHGSAFIFAVAPNKQSVYPEHLPSWAKPSGRPTRLDQFLAYMKAHSTVQVLDLRRPLQQANKMAPTYWRTDTHWNAYGGFVACEEIVRALSNSVPGLRPISLSELQLSRKPGKAGDLADCLGACMDDESVTLSPGPTLPSLVETVPVPGAKWPDYFVTNTCAAGTALVFRDSFGTAMRPFLGYHFKIVGYIWTAGDLSPGIIEQVKPEVVVSELVERNLNPATFSGKFRGSGHLALNSEPMK
jgi:hypothetical protein